STLTMPALFRPTRSNGFGFLTWRYLGDKPIHGVLQGSCSLAVLASASDAGGYQRFIMSLEPLDGMLPIDEGQGAGRKFLAACIGSLGTSERFKDNVEFDDLCFPIDQTLIDATAGAPNRYTGSLPGFFQSTTVGDGLETADDQGPVGPEVKSTEWIDVSDMDFVEQSIMLYFTGKGNRARVRYKLADGVARYYSQQSSNRNASRVYRFPAGTQSVQFYYTGRGSTVSDASIQI